MSEQQNLAAEVVIRAFTIDDQDAARTLIINGLGEHFGFIDETLNPDLDNIAASYIAHGHTFLVAERHHVLVGTGALLVQPGQIGQFVRISTHPGYRRLGIARAICQQLIARARARDLRRLIVETNHNWYDAIKLYQKLGFMENMRNSEGVQFSLQLSASE